MAYKSRLIFIVILLNTCICFASEFTVSDSVYYWFASRQSEEGIVLAEDRDNFTVEEEAVSVLVFLLRGHYNRASRVLEYFNNLRLKQKDSFGGFYRYYKASGEPLSDEILASTQLWVSLSVIWYTKITQDERYLKLLNDELGVLSGLEGPEGGLSAGYWGTNPMPYYLSEDNIIFCSVLALSENIFDDLGYRNKGWSAKEFLFKFLFDEKSKSFFYKSFSERKDFKSGIIASLTFGSEEYFMGEIKDSNILCRLMRQTALLKKNKTNKSSFYDFRDNMIWSKKHIGSAGLPAAEGGTEIDIITSAWYLLMRESFNLFSMDDKFWGYEPKNTMGQYIFTGDNFEGSKLSIILGYPADAVISKNCQVILDKDLKEIKSGSGSLRILFNPELGAANPQCEITRFFLQKQDFSLYNSIKLWIKAFSQSGISLSNVDFHLAMEDSDGEIWISPRLAVTRTGGFLNTVAMPQGWQRSEKSDIGNNLFNTDSIKSMKFIISQKDDVSWQFFIDDITLQ